MAPGKSALCLVASIGEPGKTVRRLTRKLAKRHKSKIRYVQGKRVLRFTLRRKGEQQPGRIAFASAKESSDKVLLLIVRKHGHICRRHDKERRNAHASRRACWKKWKFTLLDININYDKWRTLIIQVCAKRWPIARIEFAAWTLWSIKNANKYGQLASKASKCGHLNKMQIAFHWNEWQSGCKMNEFAMHRRESVAKKMTANLRTQCGQKCKTNIKCSTAGRVCRYGLCL